VALNTIQIFSKC